MFLNAFIPSFCEYIGWGITLIFRKCDRGCRKSLKHEFRVDGVNTGYVVQEEVDALYTGEPMYAQYVYAQVFTTIWVSLMYSAGAPILYIFVFITFVIAYWVYKHLLIRYYKTTWEFDENFVNYTLNHYKIGVILHLIMTLMMFTNQQSLGSTRMQEENQGKIYENMKNIFGENTDTFKLAFIIQ